MRARLFLAVLLLGLPLAVAAGTTETLTASAVEWQDGKGHAELLVLRHLGEAGEFTLNAAVLHVRTVVAETYAQTYTLVPGGPFYTPQWTEENAAFTNVALDGQAGRANAFLYGLPGQVKTSLDCASAQAAEPSTQPPSQIESPNPTPVIDLSSALKAQPCAPVEVCGSFTVTLWERDVEGTSTEGAVFLESGQLARPGEPDARPFLGSAQQLYLTVTDGCLTLQPTADTAVFANGINVDAPALLLRDARGRFADLDLPGTGDLQVEGRLVALLARDGSAVGTALDGHVDAASLDGQPLTLAAAPREGAPWAWAWLALLVPVAAAAWWLRRASPGRVERLLLKAEGAAEAGQVDGSRLLRLANRVLRVEPDNFTARVLRAYAFTELGRHDLALADLRSALPQAPPGQMRAKLAVEAARTCAAQGLDDEAEELLRAGFADEPAEVLAAYALPELRRFFPGLGYS